MRLSLIIAAQFLLCVVCRITKNDRHYRAAQPLHNRSGKRCKIPSQNRTTSFNIQTQSHTKSQKPKESYETRRATKRQRVRLGVLQSNKECGKAPAERSERPLGPGCRRVESCHSDKLPLKNRLIRRFSYSLN